MCVCVCVITVQVAGCWTNSSFALSPHAAGPVPFREGPDGTPERFNGEIAFPTNYNFSFGLSRSLSHLKMFARKQLTKKK